MTTERAQISKPVYYFTRVVLFLVFSIWHRIQIGNARLVPRSGGLIVAPTHRSYLDIPSIGVGLPRRPTWMAKRELFGHRLSAAFFRMYGSFPVSLATADREAIKTCVDMLKAGDAVTVFPEGGLARGTRVEEIYSGVAFMALKAKCPIVPVGIAGTEAAMAKGAYWPRPRKIVVEFGEPIDISRYEQMERREAIDALTLDLQARLQEVFDIANTRAGIPTDPVRGR